MNFSGRHWIELLRRAQEDAEPLTAAALYAHASPAHQAWLTPRLFDARHDRLLLASAGFVPPLVLARLAVICRDDAMVGLRLARNPATPADALVTLWRHGGGERLRLLLARHPHMPRGVLAQIAEGTTQVKILRALCENTGTAADVLAALERRHLPMLHRLLAINLATAADTLQSLWTAADEPAVRAQILLHPHCPACLLEAMPESVLERRCIAQQARAPVALLRQLAADADPTVRRIAAAHAVMPPQALLTLCFDPEAGVRRAVAGRADLPARMAGWLLEDSDSWVRRTVARNAACPPALVTVAAGDAHVEVRRAAARHPACPADVLERLGADPEDWVQAGVAYRDDLAPALLRRLARSASVDVLAGVARNAATSPAQIARLAAHESPDVRRAVILNRAAPREVLLALRQDGYALHRAMVLDHANLTDADRWRMRDDPDAQVRFRIFSHFARQAGVCAAAQTEAAPRAGRPTPLKTMETI
ncbi:hypothetical protein [Cupriavidus basilensis]|uniref:hypothetical protein n=1 Tax=Cupriavidus basilensis TaxID=68895 RepID=UPI0039F72BA7